MARGSTQDVLEHLTTLCRSGVLGNLNDEQLLERFTDLSDDSAHDAFATIVRRHGPMVFGVCVRVLRDMHEAEAPSRQRSRFWLARPPRLSAQQGGKLALRRRMPHRP